MFGNYLLCLQLSTMTIANSMNHGYNLIRLKIKKYITVFVINCIISMTIVVFYASVFVISR